MSDRSSSLRHVGLVFAGGMFGAVTRVALATWFPVRPGSYPWTTFGENLTGAFLLGFVLSFLAETRETDPTVRLLVGTGVLGAFTTYSTLAIEVSDLLGDGVVGTAITYAVASVALGVIAALLGIVTGGSLARRGGWAPRGNG
jgi:fluoride exporter